MLMFSWVLDTSLTCLKKDKNFEKPVNLLEMLQQRLEIISKRFLSITLARNYFFQLFLASFVKNPKAAI